MITAKDRVTWDLTRCYIEEKWSLLKIGRRYGRSREEVIELLESHGIPVRELSLGSRRRNNGDSFINEGGYRTIKVNGKWVLEHRYVWEQVHGPIPKGWLVHHINGNKADNRDKNLLGMPRTKHSTNFVLESIKTRINELETRLEISEKQIRIYESVIGDLFSKQNNGTAKQCVS